MNHVLLIQVFEQTDSAISKLEGGLAAGQLPDLQEIVDQASGLVKQLISAYIEDVGETEPPPPAADLLESFKILVKGDPSWNTIRDNCRELVYYQNCLQLDRRDALPVKPEIMAVRTLRHIFLFMKTRAMRESRLESA